MPVEAATNISQLNSSLPMAGGLISEGDDHLRLLKSVLLATFPGITGTSTDPASGSAALTATMAMVQAAILASSGITAVLPGQGGNGDKFLKTNGVSPSWDFLSFPIVPTSVDTIAVQGTTYMLTAACTLTAPAISGNGKQFGIVVLPGVSGAIFAPAGADKTRGASGTQPIDAPFSAILTDSGATYGWV